MNLALNMRQLMVENLLDQLQSTTPDAEIKVIHRILERVEEESLDYNDCVDVYHHEEHNSYKVKKRLKLLGFKVDVRGWDKDCSYQLSWKIEDLKPTPPVSQTRVVNNHYQDDSFGLGVIVGGLLF